MEDCDHAPILLSQVLGGKKMLWRWFSVGKPHAVSTLGAQKFVDGYRSLSIGRAPPTMQNVSGASCNYFCAALARLSFTAMLDFRRCLRFKGAA